MRAPNSWLNSSSCTGAHLPSVSLADSDHGHAPDRCQMTPASQCGTWRSGAATPTRSYCSPRTIQGTWGWRGLLSVAWCTGSDRGQGTSQTCAPLSAYLLRSGYRLHHGVRRGGADRDALRGCWRFGWGKAGMVFPQQPRDPGRRTYDTRVGLRRSPATTRSCGRRGPDRRRVPVRRRPRR